MSELYWLQSEWKEATCARCGDNIWKSGGDPDWGYCFNCFTENVEEKRRKENGNNA